MKLRPKEIEVVKMWLRQGTTPRQIATVIVICRMADFEIDKFAAMRSTAQTAIEEINHALDSERARGC